MTDPVFEEYIRANKRTSEQANKIFKQVAEGDYSDLTKEEKKLFVTTHEIAPEWHVKIQAAWQKYFDNSISKTINFAHEGTVQDVKDAYMQAWKAGCKGITIYRDGSKDDQVLSVSNAHTGSDTVSQLHGEEAHVCPECGGKLEKQEGCSKCYDCGYSVCG